MDDVEEAAELVHGMQLTSQRARGFSPPRDTVRLMTASKRIEERVKEALAAFSGLATTAGNGLASAEFAASNGGGAGDTFGAGVHVIYDSATGNLYYDSDGLGAANRTLMATLTLSNPADTFDYNDIKVGS